MAAEDQFLSSMKIKLKIPARHEKKGDGVQEDEGDEVMITRSGNPTGPSSSTAAVVEKGGSSSGERRKGADSKQIVGQKACPICYRTFMNGKALGGHLRIHPHRPPHFNGPSGNRSPNATRSSATNPTNVKKKKKLTVTPDAATINTADYSSPGKYYSTMVMDHKDDIVYLHGDGVNQYNTTTSTVCHVCDKEFKNLKSLFGHMRCHPEREWRGIQPPKFTTACESSTAVVVLNLQQKPPPSSGYNESSSSWTHEPAGAAAATTRVRSATRRRLRSLPVWGLTGKRGRKAVGIDDHWDHNDPDWIPQAVCDLMWLAEGGISTGRENKRNYKLKMIDDHEKAPFIIRAIAYKDPFPATTEARNNTDSTFEYGKRSDIEIEDSEMEGRSVWGNVDDYYYEGKGKKLANSDNCDSTEEKTTSLGLLQAVYDSDDDEYWLQDHVLEPEYGRTGGTTTTCTTNKAVHVVDDSTGGTTRSSGTPHDDEAAQHSTPSDKIIMSSNNRHNEKHPARKNNFIKNSKTISDHFTNNISAPAVTPAAVKFRCSTCKKKFPSYQALGGHRSSHYKERINNNRRLYR